ncbi:uncharacterized protein K02A2.6-like [Helicoverpa armigera]|uniref:uncharacterized protein K02A2.6-like n=1 Tax=Helicoverpa armigera TaxID=29058 RepID=UPI003083408B
MSRTNASNVIKVLRATFARFGLPEQLVSDQGPPFTSSEFKYFLLQNGIRQYFSPAYHPSSNGAAENAVNICKRAIKKAIRDGVDVDTALQTFLLAYRNTVHSTTGETPAMLLQKRTLRSRFDLLRTERSVGIRVHDAQQRQIDSSGGVPRSFDEGDPVWMRDYNSANKWVKGSITNVDSTRRYMIARDNGQLVKRHVDQIRRRSRLSVGGPNAEEEGTIEGESSVTQVGDNLIKSGKNEHERSDECVSEESKSNSGMNEEVRGSVCGQPSDQSPGISAQPQAGYPKRTRKPVIRFQ